MRYHLADIPLEIDPDTFRLGVTGHVEHPVSLSLAEIKALPGRDRDRGREPVLGQFPRLLRAAHGRRPAGQRCHGLRRWTGVPLKSVLDRAGVKAGAVQVTFDGMDGPVLPETRIS